MYKDQYLLAHVEIDEEIPTSQHTAIYGIFDLDYVRAFTIIRVLACNFMKCLATLRGRLTLMLSLRIVPLLNLSLISTRVNNS